VIIVDAHEDIAFNAVQYGRDYLKSALEKRQLEADSPLAKSMGIATCGLPDALLGRIALVFATLFVEPDRPNGMGMVTAGDQVKYKTPQQAFHAASLQYDYYQRLQDASEKIRIVKTQRDLAEVLRTWEPDHDITQRKQGLVLLMENADPILEPKQFEEWYERGVRLVGPAWTGTRYAGGTGEPGGLTPLGYELLDVMASFNAILDMSHLAEQAFFEALDRYEGVILASHSNPRKFRTTDRHLSDDMIRRFAERDGVMGVVPFNVFISNEYVKGDPKSKFPMSIVLDIIDYICQLTGSAAHVGIGSDWDGGFGAGEIPDGLDTVTDLLKIADGLRERGYAPADIDAIMGGNMLRKLQQTLPA
jgi:membrane dipeptidase